MDKEILAGRLEIVATRQSMACRTRVYHLYIQWVVGGCHDGVLLSILLIIAIAGS